MPCRICVTRSFFVVFLLVVAVRVWAQQPAASAAVRGRILDPQKRGVAAHVLVTYPRTGLTRETQADAAGRFSLPALAPGDVDLVITAPGFSDRRIENIHLEVGQAAEIDVDLHVSGVEQEVTVAGNAGTVN